MVANNNLKCCSWKNKLDTDFKLMHNNKPLFVP